MAGVREREVGEVEEVVDHLGGTGVPHLIGKRRHDEARVVPLGDVDHADQRLVGRQPHQPVALDHQVGDAAAGLRRDRGVDAERRDDACTDRSKR